MKQVFKRPQSLKDAAFHFCPGCHHGTIHRLVAEALDQFHLRERDHRRRRGRLFGFPLRILRYRRR